MVQIINKILKKNWKNPNNSYHFTDIHHKLLPGRLSSLNWCLLASNPLFYTVKCLTWCLLITMEALNFSDTFELVLVRLGLRKYAFVTVCVLDEADFFLTHGILPGRYILMWENCKNLKFGFEFLYRWILNLLYLMSFCLFVGTHFSQHPEVVKV